MKIRQMTKTQKLKIFSYSGNKEMIAKKIWQLFDSKTIGNYVEPFCGSSSILLSRPYKHRTIENINDINGLVINFFRSVKYDYKKVLESLRRPMNQIEYQAMQKFVISFANNKRNVDLLKNNYKFFNSEIAGAWAYCLNCSFLDHFQSVSTTRKNNHIDKGLMEIGSRKVVNRFFNQNIVLEKMHERLLEVRMSCTNWKNLLTPAVLNVRLSGKYTAIFFDPPYENKEKTYKAKPVSNEVRKWCIENGSNPFYKIILCGYESEHDELIKHGWVKQQGKSASGSQNGVITSKKEKFYYNKTIIKAIKQLTLF
jgi:site-specific DNA-adenine methylase